MLLNIFGIFSRYTFNWGTIFVEGQFFLNSIYRLAWNAHMIILFVILGIFIASDAMAKSFSVFPLYNFISKLYT